MSKSEKKSEEKIENIASLRAEVARLRELLHRDRSGLALAVARMVKDASGRLWVTEGRGSYEWNDDRYKEEAGEALRSIIAIGKEALAASGIRADEALHPDHAGLPYHAKIAEEDRAARNDHCPTCDSPAPHLHPAVQFEGEVQPCEDPFHFRMTPENERWLPRQPPLPVEVSPEDGEP